MTIECDLCPRKFVDANALWQHRKYRHGAKAKHRPRTDHDYVSLADLAIAAEEKRSTGAPPFRPRTSVGVMKQDLGMPGWRWGTMRWGDNCYIEWKGWLLLGPLTFGLNAHIGNPCDPGWRGRMVLDEGKAWERSR